LKNEQALKIFVLNLRNEKSEKKKFRPKNYERQSTTMVLDELIES